MGKSVSVSYHNVLIVRGYHSERTTFRIDDEGVIVEVERDVSGGGMGSQGGSTWLLGREKDTSGLKKEIDKVLKGWPDHDHRTLLAAFEETQRRYS